VQRYENYFIDKKYFITFKISDRWCSPMFIFVRTYFMLPMINRTDGNKHTPEEKSEAEKWFKSANEKHDRTQYRAAVDDFTMAIRILPDEADYYFCRGVSYQFLGKLRRATSDFEKAVELNPSKPGYHLLCANVLVQRDKNQAALRCVEVVLALDPAYPGALSLKQEIESNLRMGK